ncbi:alcohol dehydrogenase catalytic domain-containing protein [Phycicoccus sp. CSK15P-2]|uniref:alcohol dehydrogenase catalytic domain-containing protein n=1 Tax=Phycicoccus sp. CSK15P-2 TaxID=2807627 RepID=UPI00194E2241|nr:alcohol dehydrogenase catalytic domain-containing protein [Phycicoccus sp. CSK15P-2]MBM6405342.1 alcohol dehydrogenase catalytic domain-containing protein [Phycicoccus sp. CSK15P-2]
MRALVYDAPRATPVVTELPDPAAPPGGAVVHVVAAGLCRSDWHGWMGHDPDISTFPHVPGHELAGIVESVGEGVDPGWVGRPVTAPFVLACGTCATCAAGDGQVCPHQRQPGFTDPGCFAERVVVHAAGTNLVALPDGVPPVTAAGLGCRVATAHRAVVGRARVTSGERVLVLGCGGVGLAAVRIAASRGAHVLAADPDPGSRARAEGLGAEGTLDASVPPDDLAAAVAELTGGGVHVTIEAVGSVDACRAGALALRRRGRHVQVGLLPPAASRADIPMERVVAWELDVLGSHGMAAHDYAGLFADLAAGHLDLAALAAPGEPVGLVEAGRLLTTMGTTPSRGLVTLDPAR